MNIRADGKIAIVTGASRGIGRGIALALAEAGAFVVCAARDLARLESVVTEIAAAGGKASAHVVDVSSRESIEALIAATVAAQGRIDVLVNNAGITRDTLLLRMKPADWDDVIATNLTSVFISTQAVMKPMLKQRAGSIVNIGSVVGKNGGNARPWLDSSEQTRAGGVAYGMSKAAVHSMTLFLAKELASAGVRVNAVAPGPIATEMTTAFPENLRALIPLGRMGRADEVAAAVSFMLSDKAGFISGEILDINGALWCD